MSIKAVGYNFANLRNVVLCFVFAVCLPNKSSAMTFKISGNGGNCFMGCEYIVASGEITSTSGKEFREYLDSIAPRKAPLVLIDSFGGSLFGGIELGRAFRSSKVAVYVGKVTENPNEAERTEAGVCYSACAYAILGGIQRGIFDYDTHIGNPLSQIGFHQFYSNAPVIESEINLFGEQVKFSQEQIVSGLISSYLAEMGVDAQLLFLASTAGSNDLYAPTAEEMRQLRVIKDITSPFSSFQLQIYNNGLLLFSERLFDDQLNQLYQLTFFCQRGQVAMLATGENNSASGNVWNTDRKFNSSSDFPSYMLISLDGEKFQADAVDVEERFSTEGRTHYASVPLGVDFLEKLVRANSLEISYSIARAAGNYHARVKIDQVAKDGLAFLRTVCRG